MAKNVIILGAGASAGFGAPVMGNFLDKARKLYADNKITHHKECFGRVFEAISKLQVVHSKSELNLNNLESVFTSFELAKTLNRFPGVEPEKITDLIDDLKWVIVSTLYETVKFPTKGRFIVGQEIICNFIKSIITKRNLQGQPDTAILTFNYDLVMDMAILGSGVGVDYGISKQENCGEWLPLLKLHGSINWTTNTNTMEVFPWFLSKYFNKYSLGPEREIYPVKEALVPICYQFGEYAKTYSESVVLDNTPVIVPPSWNKMDSYKSIAKVWARAAKELSEASSIYIVGYSLPETDTFFRQLYALGSVGDTLLERFWVFNPDSSRNQVFLSMLGSGARERFKFFEVDFNKAIQIIEDGLNDRIPRNVLI